MTPKKIDYPASAPRVETGVVQFGDDWPGVFIRGDNAAALAMSLEQALLLLEMSALDPIDNVQLIGLKELLRESDVRNHEQIPPEMNPVRGDP